MTRRTKNTAVCRRAVKKHFRKGRFCAAALHEYVQKVIEKLFLESKNERKILEFIQIIQIVKLVFVKYNNIDDVEQAALLL